MDMWGELKRRNVFKVGVAYALMGWVLLQGADFALDLAGSPDWVIRALAVLVAIGLPIALFFAWAFELTPEGIRREAEVDRSRSVTPQTGRKLDYAIIGFLALVIVLMGVERWYSAEKGSAPGSETGSHPVSQTQAEMPEAGTRGKLDPTPAAKTIAVLPFADMSQAQDQGWFADGLAEEILNALTRIPDLQVSSRTSSFRYKDSGLDLPQIAAELGVAHVLEGSVRSGGGRIRVTAQLIRADDGFHVWSENYDRDEADMIGIQEDLARNIATALETTMDPAALAQMSQAGTRSVEAYKAYLKGLDLQSRGGLDAAQGPQLVLEAYGQFEQARGIDPGFALAHLRAAEFWKTQLTPSRTDSGLTELSAVQMLNEFNSRIDRAIATAPTDVDRTLFLAIQAEVALRLRDALRLYKEYVAARPHDEWGRFALVGVADMASDPDAAVEHLLHWREMPHNPDAVNAYINAAYKVIDPSQAADFGLEALQRFPNATSLIYQVHRTLMWARRFDEARQLAEQFYRLTPDGSALVAMRQACADGDRPAAERILDSVNAEDNNLLNNRWHMLILLGRDEEAVASLRPLEESGVPYQLASQLGYHKFDPSPFPSVMAVLEREGVQRPPPAEIPFKCPPPGSPSGETAEASD